MYGYRKHAEQTLQFDEYLLTTLSNPSVVVVVLILTNPSSIGNYQRIDPLEIEVITEG